MSALLKGSRAYPATFRCPNNLLHSAIEWEKLRSTYFALRGESRKSKDCNMLVRSYERRMQDESNLTDLTN